MSWAGVGQGILDAFQGGPLAADAARTRIAQQKQNLQESAEAHDADIAKLVADGTLNPSYNGMVKRSVSSGPSAYQADAPIPGVPGAGGVPSQDLSYFDKADPARMVTHKTATGHTLQFERASPADQLMAQFKANAPVRQAAFQEEGSQASQTAARQGEDKRGEYLKNLEAEGLPISDTLADLMGQKRGQKVLPGNLDDFMRAGAQVERANTAAAKPTKKVAHSEVVKDDSGKSVQVTTFEDGTVDEHPLKAVGTSAKPPAGQELTPYQKFEMDRANKTDANNRVKTWQDKIDKIQGDQDKIVGENTAAGQRVTEIQQQLDAKNGGLFGTGLDAGPAIKGKDRIKLQTEQGALRAKIQGNAAKHTELESRKQGHARIKAAIMGTNGLTDEGGTPATAAAPQAGNAPKTASQAQVAAYAQKFGMTPEAAAAAFKQDGIEVQ